MANLKTFQAFALIQLSLAVIKFIGNYSSNNNSYYYNLSRSYGFPVFLWPADD